MSCGSPLNRRLGAFATPFEYSLGRGAGDRPAAVADSLLVPGQPTGAPRRRGKAGRHDGPFSGPTSLWTGLCRTGVFSASVPISPSLSDEEDDGPPPEGHLRTASAPVHPGRGLLSADDGNPSLFLRNPKPPGPPHRSGKQLTRPLFDASAHRSIPGGSLSPKSIAVASPASRCSDGPDSDEGEAALRGLFTALQPSSGDGLAAVRTAFDRLVHESCVVRGAGGTSTKAEWAAYWELLALSGAVVRSLFVRWGPGPGDVAYTAVLDVGTETVMMRHVARFAGAQLVTVDVAGAPSGP